MKDHQSGKRIGGREGVEKVDGDKLLKQLEIRKLSAGASVTKFSFWYGKLEQRCSEICQLESIISKEVNKVNFFLVLVVK